MRAAFITESNVLPQEIIQVVSGAHDILTHCQYVIRSRSYATKFILLLPLHRP